MLLSSLLAAAPLGRAVSDTNHHAKRADDFNWTAITPTPDLQYHSCFDGFKCARLQVPLDWSSPATTGNSTAGITVAIGIVTLPATVPSTDPTFGGTVLLNPGGPGGSSTSLTLGTGRKLQSILDGDRHYELLGFDPRGIDKSTPSLDCYGGDDISLALEAFQIRGIGRIAEGPDGLRDRYEINKASSQHCEQTLPELLKHISSASVARDMVEIIDRVAEERNSSDIETKPKLQFMGFSYGSGLGMTFASMFPERVGRLMIDGILDIDDYKSASWRENLNDFEAVVDYFYQYCFEANCVLRQPGDIEWADIRTRVDDFLTKFDTNPVPITRNNLVTILTSDDLRNLFLGRLTAPVTSAESLAENVAEIMNGNYSALAAAILGNPNTEDESPNRPYSWFRDSRNAVTFADADPRVNAGNRSLEYYQEHATYLMNQTPTGGASGFSDVIAPHIGRTIRPVYSFDGPYTMPEVNSSDPNAPDAPILFLSPRLDPRTPLKNAYKMSERFPGSRVLVQESAGHCAVFASDSECTNRVLRRYFDSGELPEEGMTCEGDCEPFFGCKDRNGTVMASRQAYTPTFF